MGERDGRPGAPEEAPWQGLLDPGRQDAAHYLDFVNEPLLRMLEGAPRRVLDLGCAAGALGAAVKQRHPGARVVGIEAARAAADRAAERLDRVVHARIEDVDFGAEDLVAEQFDAVIAADVLEHMVNPWAALVGVRACVAPGAQLVASVPNVRNIWLVNRLLAGGRWEYTERGLLDVTHLRFFTLAELRILFAQTGYRVESEDATILPSLQKIYAGYHGAGAKRIELGRLTLADISAEELKELCAEQLLLRVRVGAGRPE
jgi:2-polyprenyl-3-methyl-5-hydroxy-6-metoxy-1,4-benzoquinol methylase